MQYRLDTDAATSWRSMTGTTLKLETYASAERDVSVYVRVKPTSVASASNAVTFVIPQLLAGPTGTIDYANESITGLTNGVYQYGTNGTSWTTVSATDGSCNISSLISTSARTIYLRKAATSTTPITAYTTFTIPRRPVAPNTPVFVYNDPDMIILRGLTTNMEYRRSTDTTWVPVTNSELIFDAQAKAIIYYVRNVATNDSWASAYKTLTMAAKPAAPTITYSESTETLSKLGTAYEISFNGGMYTPLTSSTYNLSGHIDNIPSGGTLEVSVRRKATASAPAGYAATLIINARTLQLAIPEILPEPGNDIKDLADIGSEVEILPGRDVGSDNGVLPGGDEVSDVEILPDTDVGSKVETLK